MTITDASPDRDEIPELPSEWFDRATVKVAGKPVNRGGRPRGSGKEQITLRLDKAVLDKFRSGGAGWQTRINDALKKAASA